MQQYLEYLKKWQLTYPKAWLFINYEAAADRYTFGVLGFDDKGAASESIFILDPKDEVNHDVIVKMAILALQSRTKKDYGIPDEPRTADGYFDPTGY